MSTVNDAAETALGVKGYLDGMRAAFGAAMVEAADLLRANAIQRGEFGFWPDELFVEKMDVDGQFMEVTIGYANVDQTTVKVNLDDYTR